VPQRVSVQVVKTVHHSSTRGSYCRYSLLSGGPPWRTTAAAPSTADTQTFKSKLHSNDLLWICSGFAVLLQPITDQITGAFTHQILLIFW